VPEDTGAVVEVEREYYVSHMLPVVSLPGKLPTTFKMVMHEHFDLDMDGLRKTYKHTRGAYWILFGWKPATQGQFKRRIINLWGILVQIGVNEDGLRSKESMMEIADFADKHLLKDTKMSTYIKDNVEKRRTRGSSKLSTSPKKDQRRAEPLKTAKEEAVQVTKLSSSNIM
jgi:hypothetical protein